MFFFLAHVPSGDYKFFFKCQASIALLILSHNTIIPAQFVSTFPSIHFALRSHAQSLNKMDHAQHPNTFLLQCILHARFVCKIHKCQASIAHLILSHNTIILSQFVSTFPSIHFVLRSRLHLSFTPKHFLISMHFACAFCLQNLQVPGLNRPLNFVLQHNNPIAIREHLHINSFCFVIALTLIFPRPIPKRNDPRATPKYFLCLEKLINVYQSLI